MDKPKGLPGHLIRWLWVRAMLIRRGMTLGVRVIALDGAGRVLLVRHGYTPGWHLPGGGVDHHETMEEAARRELEEETGYRADGTMRLLGLCYHPHQWKGDHVAVFLAETLAQVRPVEPGFEIAEIGAFAPDQLPEGTTQGTRARLAEWQTGCAVAPHWS